MAIDTTTELHHSVEDAAAHLYVWALKDIPQDLRDAWRAIAAQALLEVLDERAAGTQVPVGPA